MVDLNLRRSGILMPLFSLPGNTGIGTMGEFSYKFIDILKKSGLVEIGNHTYSYHNMNPRLGIGMLKGESEEDYKKLITDDLERMNKKIKDKTGEAPVTFTYPFGKVSSASLDVIKKIFKASLSCEEGITGIGQGDYDSLYLIKRYNRPFGTTSQEFFSKLKL